MKTVKVTTDNRISVIDVDFDNFRSIQKAIGGHFEIVHTQKMSKYFGSPVLMLCDERGHIKGLPVNAVGSYFYDTIRRGHFIAGDIMFSVPDGELLQGLEDAGEFKNRLMTDFQFLKEEG